MARSIPFLMVSGANPMVVGVSATGCVVNGGALLAAEPVASLTLTFHRQSIAELKVNDAWSPVALRAGPSSVTCDLPHGTEAPLDIQGLARVANTLRVVGAAVEIPYGLVGELVDGSVAAVPTMSKILSKRATKITSTYSPDRPVLVAILPNVGEARWPP